MKIEDLDEQDDLGGLNVAPPSTGTVEDYDDPNDERDGENEAPVREMREGTEAPEEFEVDDEDHA